MPSFADWIDTPGEFRGILVEADYLQTGTTDTVYLSNFPFRSIGTDTPAHQPYDDFIVGGLRLNRRLNDSFLGQATVAFGDIEIVNDGTLDGLLTANWRGRNVDVYMGDEDWTRADFTQVMALSGRSLDGVADDKAVLRFAEKSDKLRTGILRTLVGGTNDNPDAFKPLCFGKCYNVEPVLIDHTTGGGVYAVHEGQINDVTDVRVNGVSVPHTVSASTGTVTLTYSPNGGLVTADVEGAAPSGSWKQSANDIVQHILSTYASETNVDTTALGALPTYQLGLYIKDQQDIIDAVDWIMSSVGASWYYNRLGKFTCVQLDSPTGTPDHTLTADDIKVRGARIRRQIPPASQVRIGYKINWTPQKGRLAGLVLDSDHASYIQPNQWSEYDNTSVLTDWPEADVLSTVTLIVKASNAATEATARASQVSTLRTVYEVDCLSTPFQYNLGDEVEVTYPALGLDSGVDTIVTAISDDPLSGETVLELWK